MKDDDKVNDNDGLLKLAELEPHRPSDNPSTDSPVILRASRVPASFLPLPVDNKDVESSVDLPSQNTPSVSFHTLAPEEALNTPQTLSLEGSATPPGDLPTSLDQSLPNENQSIPPGALPDDPDPRCGYGLFSLPLDDPLTPACSAHDAANMLHHQGDNSMSRDEADKRLQDGLLLLAEHETGYRVLGSGFDKAYEILRAKILGKIGTFFNRWFW